MTRIYLRAIAAAFAAVGLCAFAGTADAQTRPGERQFVFIQGHDPIGLERAVETGAGLIRSKAVREFRVYVGGRAVLQLIRGVPSPVQSKIVKAVQANRGLTLVACKETIDVIVKPARQRPPLIGNTRIETCNNRRGTLRREGWQEPIGL